MEVFIDSLISDLFQGIRRVETKQGRIYGMETKQGRIYGMERKKK